MEESKEELSYLQNQKEKLREERKKIKDEFDKKELEFKSNIDKINDYISNLSVKLLLDKIPLNKDFIVNNEGQNNYIYNFKEIKYTSTYNDIIYFQVKNMTIIYLDTLEIETNEEHSYQFYITSLDKIKLISKKEKAKILEVLEKKEVLKKEIKNLFNKKLEKSKNYVFL